MAIVTKEVPTADDNNTGADPETLSTTLELGDTLRLDVNGQASNWTFSQADSFFNSTDVGGTHVSNSTDGDSDDTYDIDCDGSYPSGSQTTLNVFKSANSVSPYFVLTVNTQSLDPTITKDLIHNGSSINGFPIYYSPDGNVTFSYTNGGAYTRYRVITTSASSSPSGTVINGRGCGNAVGTSGTIDIEYKATGNELCNIEGSQVSYKVQYRPRNLATTYQDTGTTFTLTHIVSSPGTISVSNAGNSSQTETVTVSCAINPPTDCILEFSTSSSFSSNVVAADANREADFSQTRNTTVTYYARFRNTTTNAVTFGTYPSVSHTVNYLSTDATIPQMTVASNANIFPDTANLYYIVNDNTTTSPTVQLTGLDSNQEYSLTNDSTNDPDQAGVIVEGTIATGNTSGNISVSNSNILTIGGGAYSWYPWTRRPTSKGGDNTWVRCTIDGTLINRVVFVREDALITPTIESVSLRIDSTDYSKVVPIVELSDASAPSSNGGDLVFGYSSSDSTPSATFTHPDNSGQPAVLFYSGNVNFDKTVGTIYVSVRRESTVTDAVSDRNYDSITFSASSYYATPGGANLSVYLNNNNNTSFAGYVGDGNNEIRLFSGDTATEVVLLEGLSNPSISVVDKEDSASTLGALDTSVTVQSQYGIDITSGSTAGTPVLTTGDNVGSQFLPIGDTSDTISLITSELPAVGNTVNYEVWRRQLVANGGSGTKQYPNNAASESEFFARRFDEADYTITVTGVRQTLANNHSTDLVLTITDGNSSTQYQLYSQGAVYDTRVGNGTLTATNPGELPTAGNTRNYNIQYRQDGTSDTYQNTSGTGTSFTLGRLAAMDLGTLSNPVSVEATTSSAVITLSGAVGNITALLTKNSGGGTVRLSKNGQTFANSTASGTSITVVNGDTLQVLAETPTTYSNTTQSTLTLTQDSVTIFSDTFSFTTESSPGGSAGGGGGTGNYGLEIRDSSGNIILTNSDRVGDFCYATSVNVADGASTGVSTSQTPGGNVVIIEENLNPNTPNNRVSASLENNGTQVRINMLGVTADGNLTFNVLVFNV